MKRSYVFVKMLFVMILFLALSCNLVAQPSRDRLRQPEQNGRFSQDMPGLMEEQRSQIREIHLATLQEVQPLQDELKVNNARLNAMLKQDEPDMQGITKLVEANADIQARIRLHSIEGMISTRSLLTEEQKILFDAGQLRLQRPNLAMEPGRRRDNRRWNPRDFQGRQRLYPQSERF